MPTPNSKYVIVITTPRIDNSGSTDACVNDSHNIPDKPHVNTSLTSTFESESSTLSSDSVGACASESTFEGYGDVCGCMLVYKIVTQSSHVVCLDETPVARYVSRSLVNTVKSIIFLPADIAHMADDDDESHESSPISTGTSGTGSDLEMQVAAVMFSGEISIIRLSDFNFLSKIASPEDDAFVSVTFCSGEQRYSLFFINSTSDYIFN